MRGNRSKEKKTQMEKGEPMQESVREGKEVQILKAKVKTDIFKIIIKKNKKRFAGEFLQYHIL